MFKIPWVTGLLSFFLMLPGAVLADCREDLSSLLPYFTAQGAVEVSDEAFNKLKEAESICKSGSEEDAQVKIEELKAILGVSS